MQTLQSIENTFNAIWSLVGWLWIIRTSEDL